MYKIKRDKKNKYDKSFTAKREFPYASLNKDECILIIDPEKKCITMDEIFGKKIGSAKNHYTSSGGTLKDDFFKER